MNYKSLWTEGYKAREEGKPLEANLYPEDRYAYEPWEEGWYDCDCDMLLEDEI